MAFRNKVKFLATESDYNTVINLKAMGTLCFRVEEEEIKAENAVTFFDLKANDITGRRIDFYIYKNRAAFLLVNVATKSPLAKLNYQMLNELHAQFRDHGLEIMAFPCDQFGNS
jgi:glutathione peroxidase